MALPPDATPSLRIFTHQYAEPSEATKTVMESVTPLEWMLATHRSVIVWVPEPEWAVDVYPSE